MAWCRHTTALSEHFFFTVVDNNPCVVLIPLFLRLPYARQEDMVKLQWKINKQNVSKTNKAWERHKRITIDLNKLLENHLYFISVYNARILPRNIAIINLCAWADGHITRYISNYAIHDVTCSAVIHASPSHLRFPVHRLTAAQHIKPPRFYLWMGSH